MSELKSYCQDGSITIDTIREAFRTTGYRPNSGTWSVIAGTCCPLRACAESKVGRHAFMKMSMRKDVGFIEATATILGLSVPQVKAFTKGFDGAPNTDRSLTAALAYSFGAECYKALLLSKENA